MRHLGYAVCAVLLVGVLTVGCGEEEGTAVGPGGTVMAQKGCPVMGNPIDKTIFTEYKGQKVYFCCAACVETFKKEPEKYLPKLETWCTKCSAWKADCGCK